MTLRLHSQPHIHTANPLVDFKVLIFEFQITGLHRDQLHLFRDDIQIKKNPTNKWIH